MKKRIVLAMAALMMVSAAGCKKGSENRLDVSGLYVKTDLSIVGTFVEPFEKSYYNETELRLMVEDEIKSYNKEKVKVEAFSDEDVKSDVNLPISLDSVDVKDKQATVIMEYDSGEDYVSFNESYVIGEKKGSTVHTSLVKDSLDQLEGNFVTEKGKSVTLDEIKSHGDYKMLYVDFDTTVKVEGKVTYISDNVTVESDNTVTTTSGQGSIIIFH